VSNNTFIILSIFLGYKVTEKFLMAYNDKHEIVLKKKVHDSGIKIVIATGRAASDLHEIDAVPYDGVIALFSRSLMGLSFVSPLNTLSARSVTSVLHSSNSFLGIIA